MTVRQLSPEVPRRGASTRRLGFTLVEMLMVVTVIGVSSLIVLPKLGGNLEAAGARAARDRLAQMFAMARSTATMTGQTTYLKIKGDSAWILRGTTTVARAVHFQNTYGVALSAPIDSVAFGPRGFATNLSAAKVFRLTRNSYNDSICVSKLGLIAKRCGL